METLQKVLLVITIIGAINWGYYAVSLVFTLVILTLGIVFFNKVERTFMDTV